MAAHCTVPLNPVQVVVRFSLGLAVPSFGNYKTAIVTALVRPHDPSFFPIISEFISLYLIELARLFTPFHGKQRIEQPFSAELKGRWLDREISTPRTRFLMTLIEMKSRSFINRASAY